MLVFDKFEVEMETEYDEKVYVVYGERGFLPEETAVFQKQKEEDLEKEKDGRIEAFGDFEEKIRKFLEYTWRMLWNFTLMVVR